LGAVVAGEIAGDEVDVSRGIVRFDALKKSKIVRRVA
jgi:hypothetical protein